MKCRIHGNAPARENIDIKCAVLGKTILVKRGKLDHSWTTIKHEKNEHVDGKKGRKGKKWNVSFKNPAVIRTDKSTRFVFISLPGSYVTANITWQ